MGSRESDHFRVIEKRGNHEVGTGDGDANPRDVDAVDPDTIDAMFVPGGAGPMEDLYDDRDWAGSWSRCRRARHRSRPSATGPSACSRPAGGTWIFAGYQMTGYTDEEESQGGPGNAAPFTLESRLRAEGAGFTAGAPWSEFTVTDRNLITGQNPGSAAAVARQLVTALGRQ